MKLTEKDKVFLERLRTLIESKDLQVEPRHRRPGALVLCGTYGERIHEAFGMSRQGVRWRFSRIFNDIYVSAFETIIFIEQTFGPRLREHAVRISRERYELRQRMRPDGFQRVDSRLDRRETPEQ